jgi:cytochrome P450
MVTTYDDVYEVIRNDDIFSALETGLGPGREQLPPLHYDPPEHTAYRTLMNPVFSPARMKAIEDDIRHEARRLLDTFAADGHCEFVSQFGQPYQTLTFLSLMGWPFEDERQLSEWSNALVAGPPGSTPEELGRARIETRALAREYFQKMIQGRRDELVAGEESLVDDVTGYLLQATYDDGTGPAPRPLTDDELLRMLSLLMVAGLHTIRGVMGHGLIRLAQQPDQRQRLIDDPSLIAGAVEEFLRLDVGNVPARLVLEPVTVHGVQMQPGDRVVGFLSAANRDPSVFACPFDFQIDREHNRHVAFAVGRHRCLGSNLARVELNVAFEEILPRLRDFRLDPGHPPTFHAGQIRGIRDLHLLFTPGG